MSGLIRRAMLLVPILLSIGVPYVMVGESMEPARAKIKSWISSRNKDDGGDLSATLAAGKAMDNSFGTLPGQASSGAQVPPVTDIRQILRYDITPEWVLQRWPRATTTMADNRLEGLRVSLVTGTRPHDVAGSLTYYFNSARQLQRIGLRGFTSDPRPLVSLVTRDYRFQPQPAPGVELYVAKWNGKPTSGLCIRRAPVAVADSTRPRFEVALELNRPNNYSSVSPGFQRLLATGQPAAVPTVPRKPRAPIKLGRDPGLESLYGY